MKNVLNSKILIKLILYFVTSFAVFAFVIGLLFAVLFSRHNIHVHHAELERRVVNIADSLSEYIFDGIMANAAGRRGMQGMMGMRQGMMGAGAFLRFIEDIAMSDVWVVDAESNQIVFVGQQIGLSSHDLPEDSGLIISHALSGEVAFCESFSLFWDTPTITVAAPIVLSDGDIAGAVLLHSQVSAIHQVTRRGLILLVYSICVGVIMSAFVAVVLSKRFTNPLSNMKDAALRISDGDYKVKTDVEQKDEIGELAAIMDDMASKLNIASKDREKLDNLRKDFVANISHELRTPITVIRGSLEALLDGVVSDSIKVKDFHAEMLNECKYLERLVSDLLDLSRLQNADFAIEIHEINIQDIIQDVAGAMSIVAAQNEIALVLNSETGKFHIIGDYYRLRQMFIIVLDNAIKFSPANSTVAVDLSNRDDTVYISIKDQGGGIPNDDIPHIFDRFYKQRSEQNKSGTGLGLAIAKQIANRHGITLTAKNCIDVGAEFRFEIPIANL